MAKISGAPDSNHKPSITVIDTITNNPFAVEGNSDLGASFVQILDGSGNPIVTFGSPTEYTDGNVIVAHPIGPTIQWSDGTHWQTVSTAQPLPVTIKNSSLPVTGTFWQTTQPVSGTFWQATQPVSFTQPALVAGSAIIGKVTTDQTTHGTTDLVAADITKIGGTTLTLGQQTAANSIPVILPSTTITALTPPSNTGFALDASLSTLNTSVNTLLKPASTLTAVTTVSTLTNQSQEGGVAISLNAGAVDTGTRRIVQANGAGKTILSAGGSAASNGNNTLVAAGTNRLKVFAFTLSTTSTTAMTCIFQSGAGGTELWRVVLQAPTSISTGANLVVTPPAWLFATASAALLNLNLSSANAVHWSVSYFDEA